MDAAELLDSYTDAIYASTYTAEEVVALKERKKMNETIMLCRAMLRDETWEHDATVNELDVYLTYASTLESLTRRYEAIDILVRGIDIMDEHPMLRLALARLQFKAGLYEEALESCLLVAEAYPNDTRCSKESAADAYHLAGWVKIHGDDHTNAYALWSRGAKAVPSSAVLARQYRKRQCWDDDSDVDLLHPGLVGQGASGLPAEGFAVPPSTRAVALFNPNTQANRVVFRSTTPLLTKDECANVVDIVHAFHRETLDGRWGTVRHSSVKTTDVAVEDIPSLRPWLKVLLQSRVYPFLHACFPSLADHTTMMDPVTMQSRCRVHDAFIVRYDEVDESLSLPEHNDTSVTSVVVSLNDRFQGGGTWFEALGHVVDADVGHAVAFAGPLRHGGHAITSGCRLILVLFLYVDGFAYGDYLANFAEDNDTNNAGAGKGFVVYNQTVELVATLNEAPPATVTCQVADDA
ncbi:hypothetical protein, variant [Aphanomyces invadans]|uniref:Fe2OG dioxygenase domain-containing protein n=1 Tax=Aphanomyces invadans TaxID=157072 RepID=A0A024TVB3_9STRA|nr:hypothetical protein H310_09475 [Aphanomyces invadans]XP_008873781.1 hypothetical protein, variant [Aphanomyces invadans]ETV97571.1 hypothetical protein H310_09475 [Aphanomyces invadans]ETV97572.1 hypothetical protein, variant [Aphanomyces invadans]|eukprot:XP_008873780.1 hypothetical protein H310_09475 [Aphanomyces invadans]